MKRVFETAECEAVMNSIFWELRYEKHETAPMFRYVFLFTYGLLLKAG